MDSNDEHPREEVLALVCHSGGLDIQTACSCLCVSKSTTAAILRKCSGPGNSTLSLEIGGDFRKSGKRGADCLSQVSQQTLWLAKYSGLIKSTRISLIMYLPNVAAALVELAFQSSGLRLQELALGMDGQHVPSMLRALQPEHVTRLQLDMYFGDAEAEMSLVSMDRALSAVARFSSLQELHLAKEQCKLQGLTGALARLPRLAGVTLPGGLDSADKYAQLPMHLTRLSLRDMPGDASIAHLQSLQELEMHNPQCTATQLVTNITSLASLAKLMINYRVSDARQKEDMLSQAKVWGELKHLQQLRVWSGVSLRLPHSWAAIISAATELTSLKLALNDYGKPLDDGHVPSPEEAGSIAMLQPLKQLQQLELLFDNGGLSCYSPLLPKTGLNQLTSLELRMPIMPVLAKASLYAQQQLRRLRLYSIDIGDDGLAIMGYGLLKLEHLWMEHCGVTASGVKNVLVRPSLFPQVVKLDVQGQGHVLHWPWKESAAVWQEMIKSARGECTVIEITTFGLVFTFGSPVAPLTLS